MKKKVGMTLKILREDNVLELPISARKIEDELQLPK